MIDYSVQMGHEHDLSQLSSHLSVSAWTFGQRLAGGKNDNWEAWRCFATKRRDSANTTLFRAVSYSSWIPLFHTELLFNTFAS